MATLFVRHRVADFGAWKKAYDSFAPMQKAMGVTGESVYQSADDPNDVTVTHDFASIGEAQTFVSSPDLRDVMQSAGVVGEPTIWFTTKA